MITKHICETEPTITDIKKVCADLKWARIDWVKAYAAGENGPFHQKDLAELQSVILAFEAVLAEHDTLASVASGEGETMTEEQGMTITQIIRFAETEKCGIDNLAVVCGGNGKPFEVQHDYGDANVSYWETHEEARAEAGRLWNTGEVSRIEDHIVAAAERRNLPEEYATA